MLKRDFKSVDFEAVNNHLSSVDWYGSLDSVDTVDEKYELFLAVLNHCIELFVPIIKVPLHDSCIPPHLTSLSRKRSLAWRTAVEQDTTESWAAFSRLNKIFSKRLWKFNNNLEKKIVRSKDKNAFYKLINSRIRPKNNIGVLVSSQGTIAQTDREKAEMLADVFELSFSQCKRTEVLQDPMSFPKMSDSIWFYGDDIYNLISKWPSSYSETPDHIPLAFIKGILHTITRPLEYIFNLSFMRSEVPSRWKLLLVTPIPKKPPYTSPTNFRPISITSIFARTFEKILKKKIESHLEEHSIISEFQHGFQKNKSAVTAMLQTLNDWTINADEGYRTDVVYLDFCKAFDKVPHENLLRKLVVIGIHPRINAWIRAFPADRVFRVRINNTLSEPRHVWSGVPQGGGGLIPDPFQYLHL
ncbi:hypothetical protein Y032_0009g735 [Ancylostoma ceylanicum]|uniref:Reverse transcriptase domain-containing protein n=1 Tax=Ancylostoma ceylanicum TaxID=53326 RepID=A0A016VK95_9BILA|nr:hypothetical protein Y032_0009g735 [Ancylostoma ceylanicum]